MNLEDNYVNSIIEDVYGNELQALERINKSKIKKNEYYEIQEFDLKGRYDTSS